MSDAEPTPEQSAEGDAFDKQREYDLRSICNALDRKESCGLTVEILYQAMLHLQSRPTDTISEAIQHGFDEWVK